MTCFPEMKKCSNCKCSFTLNYFRAKKNQCRECEQAIQNKNRRERYKSIGMRKDPTRLVSDLEAKAMHDLNRKCGWTQDEIAVAFNLNQCTVSINVRKIEGAIK